MIKKLPQICLALIAAIVCADVHADNMTSQLYIEAIHVPTFRLRADREDINDFKLESVFKYNLHTGGGYGVAVGVLGLSNGGEGWLTTNLLYMNAKNSEKDLDFTLQTQSLYLEFGVGNREDITNHVAGFWDLRLGVGGAHFDYPSEVAEDDREGAIEMRGQLGVEFHDFMQLSLGFGVYMWGYPGETVAQGDFSTLQLNVRF